MFDNWTLGLELMFLVVLGTTTAWFVVKILDGVYDHLRYRRYRNHIVRLNRIVNTQPNEEDDGESEEAFLEREITGGDPHFFEDEVEND